MQSGSHGGRMIVDSQVHIWVAERPDRPWPATGWDGKTRHVQRDVPLEADELIGHMDEAGVARAILVPPSWEGYYNDVVIDACSRWPDRFAAMGRFAEEWPLEQIARWRDTPGMLGIRLIPLPGSAFADAGHPFWRACAEANLPLMLPPLGQTDMVADIARRYPSLRITLDHLGLGAPGQLNQSINEAEVLALAAHPNVAVKLSAVPCSSKHASRPWPDMTPFLRRLTDAYGPGRCFWGSDLSRLPCPYRELIDHFEQDLDWLSSDDLDLIMGKAILDWLCWD